MVLSMLQPAARLRSRQCWSNSIPPDAGKARATVSAVPSRRAFPASGGIEFDQHWRDLKRAAGCNMDNTMIADKFRAWCAGK
ncbi:hypothetical protein DTW92_20915, partial [Paracoccus pantotrophus]